MKFEYQLSLWKFKIIDKMLTLENRITLKRQNLRSKWKAQN